MVLLHVEVAAAMELDHAPGPGAAIGRRALGADRYVAKIHGSDLEYAVRIQERYRELAREGLEAARAKSLRAATADPGADEDEQSDFGPEVYEVAARDEDRSGT